MALPPSTVAEKLKIIAELYVELFQPSMPWSVECILAENSRLVVLEIVLQCYKDRSRVIGDRGCNINALRQVVTMLGNFYSIRVQVLVNE